MPLPLPKLGSLTLGYLLHDHLCWYDVNATEKELGKRHLVLGNKDKFHLCQRSTCRTLVHYFQKCFHSQKDSGMLSEIYKRKRKAPSTRSLPLTPHFKSSIITLRIHIASIEAHWLSRLPPSSFCQISQHPQSHCPPLSVMSVAPHRLFTHMLVERSASWLPFAPHLMFRLHDPLQGRNSPETRNFEKKTH